MRVRGEGRGARGEGRGEKREAGVGGGRAFRLPYALARSLMPALTLAGVFASGQGRGQD